MAWIIRLLLVFPLITAPTAVFNLSFAQENIDLRVRQEALPPPSGMIRMTLQGDVKLDALVGFISQRVGVKYAYDDKIASRTITIRTPQEIPIASLSALLGSVLRTERLTVVDSDTPGWKRIVEVTDMTRFATPMKAPQSLDRNGPASVVTQVFVLKNLNAKSLGIVLEPFLSGTEAKVASIDEANAVIVTDYASSITTMSDLLDLIDQPAGEGSYQVYEAKFQVAQMLTEQVKGILATQTSGDKTGTKVKLFTEPVGKRIVIAGSVDWVKRAMELLKRLDVSLGITTEVYRIRNTNAGRIDKLIRGFVEPPNDESSYQTTVDSEGNLLIVLASEEVHRQVAKLIAELDTAVDTTDSPIQFYKLKNASALDVLYSLLALQEAYGMGGFSGGVPGAFYSPFGGGGLGFPGNGFGGFPGMGSQAGAQGQGNRGGLTVTPLPLVPNGDARDPLVPQRQNPLAQPTAAAGPGAGLDGNMNSNSQGGQAGYPSARTPFTGGLASGGLGLFFAPIFPYGYMALTGIPKVKIKHKLHEFARI